MGQVPAEAPGQTPLRGIRGWLLLFVVGLTILGPLVTTRRLITAYTEVAPLFDQFPGLLVIIVVDAVLSAALMGYSVYAGVRLWRIQPNAVSTAKRFLYLFLGYSVLAVFLGPLLAGLPPEANKVMIEESVKDLVRGVLFFAIWYSYLKKSKRVAATFGPGLDTSATPAPPPTSS